MKSEITILPEIRFIMNEYPKDREKRIFEYFLHLQENQIKICRDKL